MQERPRPEESLASPPTSLDGARYAAIVEHQQELVCRFLPDTTLTFVNRAYAAFFGAEKAALLGRRWIEFLPVEARAAALGHVHRVAEGGMPVTYEHEVVGPDGALHWQEWVDHPVLSESGEVVELQSVGRDVTERHREQERLRFLLGELDHRVKNQLAVIQAIARATLREQAEPEAFVGAFLGSIDPRARAQHALSRSGWQSVDLEALVRGCLGPFAPERWSAVGSRVQLPVRSTQPIAMALHELATNAAKYGALSGNDGRVAVTWQVHAAGTEGHPERLTILWRESGGPPAIEPPQRGLGLRIVTEGLEYELGGAVTLCFDDGGLAAELAVPMPHP